MKLRKVLLTVFSALLIVCLSVGATVAYLTSKDSVTNTFTVGNVKITMDETKVNEYGNAVEGEARVTENTYKLIPGHTYTKDPIIHVDKNSEDCWLFVHLDNGIGPIMDDTTVENQMIADGNWTKIDGANNVYYYKNAVKAGANIDVFKTVTIKASATNDDIDGHNNHLIQVTAYAVQADGFDTALAAWNAAPKAEWQGVPSEDAN